MVKVKIEKELEDWWGIDDLLESLGPNATREEREKALFDLVNEDLIACLDGAVWTYNFEGDKYGN